MPEVSVIIPTWNRAYDAQKAVESVFQQTYQDFEIIVADDGSTDETSNIFSCYPDTRLHYLQLTHSGLPAVARNAALRESRGKWVAFLDSDDIWLPIKLQKQIEIINTTPEAGLICTNALRDIGEKDSQVLFHKNLSSSQIFHFDRLIQSNLVIASSTLVKKEIIDTLGGFPEGKIYRAVEDYHLWLRVVLHSALYYIAEPLIIYNDSGESIRSLQSKIDDARGILQIFNDLVSLYDEQIVPFRTMIDEKRVNYLKSLINIYSDQGKLINCVQDVLQLITVKSGHLSRNEYRWVADSLIKIIRYKLKK